MVSPRFNHARCETTNPFCIDPARQAVLAQLKRAIVRLGLTGQRRDFKLAQTLFEVLPELRKV